MATLRTGIVVLALVAAGLVAWFAMRSHPSQVDPVEYVPSSLPTKPVRPAEELPQPVERSGENPPVHTFLLPQGTISIQFPDGEALEVAFRRVPWLMQAHTDDGALSPTDDGSDAYAFSAYRRAVRCLESLRGSPQVLEQTPCPGSADGYTRDRDRWLQIAVDRGNIHALRELIAVRAASVGPEEQIHLYRQAWEVGFIPPLGRIAEIHLQRARTDSDRAQAGIAAVAYLWLHAHLQDRAAGGGRRSYVADLYEKLELAQRDMTSADFDSAMQLAKDLLKANTHCCFGP